MFGELYEKIQRMVIESAEAYEKIASQVDYKRFYIEVKEEVPRTNKNMEGVKRALNLLEIAVERTDCPEVLKQQQHDMLVVYKDLLRRGYY
jgi:TPP-dependent 2-oxoacid decarboxylase